MNKADKIQYLLDNHFSTWREKYKEVEQNISEQQKYICVCGRLATGLHESSCSRFKEKVKSETLKQLKHLIPTQRK